MTLRQFINRCCLNNNLFNQAFFGVYYILLHDVIRVVLSYLYICFQNPYYNVVIMNGLVMTDGHLTQETDKDDERK